MPPASSTVIFEEVMAGTKPDTRVPYTNTILGYI